MKEIITIETDYEIEYEPGGRDKVIQDIVNNPSIDVQGCSIYYGCYSMKRLKSRLPDTTQFGKEYWRDKSPGGFYWSYFDGKLHHFSKRVGHKFLSFKCTDKEVTDGSYLEMIKDGITR